jgi:hypothetical protein
MPRRKCAAMEFRLANAPKDLTKAAAAAAAEVDQTFVREVDEGVRRDQLLTLWQRYGRIGIAAVLLGLAALGGWLFWQDRQAVAAGKAGEQLVDAIAKLEVGEGARARPVLGQLASEGPRGYTEVARLMQAADAAAGNDDKRAIVIYDSIAGNEAASPALRDLALVRSVRLSFDTAAPATVVKRLKPLVVPGNPWFAIAAEMSVIAHLKANEIEAAKPLITAIVKDKATPRTLRQRVAELGRSLGIDPALLEPATVVPAPPVAAAAPPPATASIGAAEPAPVK